MYSIRYVLYNRIKYAKDDPKNKKYTCTLSLQGTEWKVEKNMHTHRHIVVAAVV